MNISDGRPITVSLLVAAVFATTFVAQAKPITAEDKGPRRFTGDPNEAPPLPGLTRLQRAFFLEGEDEFSDAEGVLDGLGPTMNLNSCKGCHAYPYVGGTSPATNPQVVFATRSGNSIPST